MVAYSKLLGSTCAAGLAVVSSASSNSELVAALSAAGLGDKAAEVAKLGEPRLRGTSGGPRALAASVPTFVPDAEFLGYGYHILKADPFAQGPDPAFAGNVMELSYNEGRTVTTGQGIFQKPDFVTLTGTTSCTANAAVSSVENAKDYQDSLKVSVKVEGEAPTGGSASLSAGYDKMTSGKEAKGTRTMVQNAFCEAHELSLEKNLKWEDNLSQNFKNKVSTLPTSYNNKDPKVIAKFRSFFDQFGTHMVEKLTLGGRVSRTSTFSHTAITKMESTGVNVAVAAKASYAGFSAGASAQTDSEKKMASSFDSASEDHSTSFTGGTQFQNGDWITWAKSVKESPAPVKYELMAIDSVVQKLGGDFAKIAQAVKEARSDLCAQTDKCVKDPDSDKTRSILGGFYQVDECNVENVYNPLAGNRLECPPKYKAYDVGRHMTQSGCGANVYLCVRAEKGVNKIAAQDGFGGVYGKHDDSGLGAIDSRKNPFTGALSCPSGTRGHTAGVIRSMYGRPYTYVICLGDLDDMGRWTTAMGGFYQEADADKRRRINNPVTHALTCSNGFEPTPWFRGQNDSGGGEGGNQGDGQNGIVCL